MSFYAFPVATDGTQFKRWIATKQLKLMKAREAKAAERRAISAARREQSMSRLVAPLRPSLVALTVLRVASIADQPLRAVPKSPRQRNKAVLDMARGKPCLLLSPICKPDPATTVACHGAGVANGKGMGYKTGDFLTVHGCFQCNHYTDDYNGATAEQKLTVFEAGHARQLIRWREIAADTKAAPRDRRAAQWALDRWAEFTAKKEAKNV